MSGRVVVVGGAAMDLIATTPAMPGDGETVMGTSFTTDFGGKGANQAVAAARLGVPVSLVCALGADAYGDDYEAHARAEGLDLDGAVRVPGPTGVALILVSGATGDNRIVAVPGANARLTPDDAARGVAGAADGAVVCGQLELSQAVTAAAFAAARERGATTVLNPSPAGAIDQGLMAHTDWLVPNEVEFEQLAGRPPTPESVAALAGRLGAGVVVTLGEQGALVASAAAVERVPAPTVTARNTVGAGDCMLGALAAGLALGLAPLDAVRLGVAAASLSVTRDGTQASFPTREEARALLDGAGG